MSKPTKEEVYEQVKIISQNFTKIIPTTILESYKDTKYKSLYWGGNGVGNRWCYSIFNYTSIYYNNVKKYSENDDTIPENILSEFVKSITNKTNKIIGIYVHSIKSITNTTRNIRVDIKKSITKDSKCVVCGSSNEIVCDHKNDLYNDLRVLHTTTQTIDDFQPLCNHCNLQKREISKKEKINNKIYSAKNIPMYKSFPFAFPWEYKDFRNDDITTKSDTFWYDPIEFNRKIALYSLLLPVLQQIKKLQLTG